MALVDKIKKIDILKKELDDLQPVSKENEDKLWKKFRLEWNFNSNHIEGNTLTYGETELLIIFDKTAGNHELREYEEMKAHDVAIHLIKEWSKDKTRRITETDIRNLNEVILVRPYWKEALTYDGQPTRRLIKIGQYKDHPNSVKLPSGEMFHYASPQETPGKMADLMTLFEQRSKDLHPVFVASNLHYQFVLIHPFDDGNGRVSRLLANLYLMQEGYPPIIIKTEDKKAYLTALQKSDAGDKPAFYEYMADQLIWSLEKAIKASKGESIEDEDDVDKEIFLLKKQLSDKDIIKIKRSEDTVLEVFKTSILQFAEYAIKELSGLNDFFMSNSQNFTFQGQNKHANFEMPNNSHDLNREVEKITTFGFPFTSCTFTYMFNGFSYSRQNPHNTSVSLQVDFEQYRYVLNARQNGRKELIKLYDEKLTEEENKLLAKEMKREMLETIKRWSESSK